MPRDWRIRVDYQKNNDNTNNLKEHEFCLRCGRRLKKLENRIIGYGNICYKKQQSEPSKNRLF